MLLTAPNSLWALPEDNCYFQKWMHKDHASMELSRQAQKYSTERRFCPSPAISLLKQCTPRHWICCGILIVGKGWNPGSCLRICLSERFLQALTTCKDRIETQWFLSGWAVTAKAIRWPGTLGYAYFSPVMSSVDGLSYQSTHVNPEAGGVPPDCMCSSQRNSEWTVFLPTSLLFVMMRTDGEA